MTDANARTFKVPGRRDNSEPWGKPVVQVCKGYQIKITAKGTVKHSRDDRGRGPTGFGSDDPGTKDNLAPGLATVGLIAKVGDGAPFFVGDGTTYTATANGDLYFSVNSFTWSFEDNSGEFEVAVSGEGLPEPGWTHCRALAEPKIKIMGTKAVSDSALDAVEKIYSEMTSRLKSTHDKSKFDDFKVYITNGEPWSELSKVAPVGTMWSGKENGIDKGDDLRGGSNAQYLWISEQMICKTGVKTRNDSNKDGKRTKPDNEVRTYDQVVHELAHSIARKYGLDSKITEIYGGDEESYAWSVQNWFGAPSGTLSEDKKKFMESVFSSQTTFSKELYESKTDG